MRRTGTSVADTFAIQIITVATGDAVQSRPIHAEAYAFRLAEREAARLVALSDRRRAPLAPAARCDTDHTITGGYRWRVWAPAEDGTEALVYLVRLLMGSDAE